MLHKHRQGPQSFVVNILSFSTGEFVIFCSVADTSWTVNMTAVMLVTLLQWLVALTLVFGRGGNQLS